MPPSRGLPVAAVTVALGRGIGGGKVATGGADSRLALLAYTTEGGGQVRFSEASEWSSPPLFLHRPKELALQNKEVIHFPTWHLAAG